MSVISIQDLETCDLGLSPGMAKYVVECIQHCFRSQNHFSGVKMVVKLDGEEEVVFSISWDFLDEKNFKYSMNDDDRTTDFGAMGISLLLVTNLTEFRYFVTSMKGNGFDFWLFRNEPDDLDYSLAEGRLEISGIRRQTSNNTITRRLRIKREQIGKSESSGIPGCVSIVEFQKPQSIFQWL